MLSVNKELKFFIVCVDLNISINAPTDWLENVGVTSRVKWGIRPIAKIREIVIFIVIPAVTAAQCGSGRACYFIYVRTGVGVPVDLKYSEV
jgi:hypothetical protein